MYDTESVATPPRRRDTLTGNPFWLGIFFVWILMLIMGVTLALALGVWTLIGAF